MAGPELDEAALVYKPNFNLRGPGRLVLQFDQIKRITGKRQDPAG